MSDTSHEMHVILETQLLPTQIMMTSWNGNIFRVTGNLRGDFTGVAGEFPAQRPVTRSFDVFLPFSWVIPPTKCMWYWKHNFYQRRSWWRHEMETFYALLAICAEISPVLPVTRSFDVFCDLRLDKRLSKQSRGWWFETPSRPLWRHRNVKLISIKSVAWINVKCGL